MNVLGQGEGEVHGPRLLRVGEGHRGELGVGGGLLRDDVRLREAGAEQGLAEHGPPTPCSGV